MRDSKEIISGMRDEIILSGPGYLVLHGRDARCFEIDGRIEDHKNHFMTEKTPNNDIQSMRPCPRPPRAPLVLGPVVITLYNELWLCARVTCKGHTTSVTILLNDLNAVECAMANVSRKS